MTRHIIEGLYREHVDAQPLSCKEPCRFLKITMEAQEVDEFTPVCLGFVEVCDEKLDAEGDAKIMAQMAADLKVTTATPADGDVKMTDASGDDAKDAS